MTFRNLIGLLFIISFCCCSDDQPKQLSEKHFGTSITNSMRRGRIYEDSTGTKYFYPYISVSITNDSLIPMHLEIAFSNEYYQPTPINGQKFRVFLLPETMTPEKQFNNDFYAKEVKPFLDSQLETPITLNRIINPKEEYILNIGFLTEFKSPLNLNPLPFMLFSKGHRHQFESIPDSVINQVISEKNQLTLLLGLDFYQLGLDSIKRYSLIPCGQISF